MRTRRSFTPDRARQHAKRSTAAISLRMDLTRASQMRRRPIARTCDSLSIYGRAVSPLCSYPCMPIRRQRLNQASKGRQDSSSGSSKEISTVYFDGLVTIWT